MENLRKSVETGPTICANMVQIMLKHVSMTIQMVIQIQMLIMRLNQMNTNVRHAVKHLFQKLRF